MSELVNQGRFVANFLNRDEMSSVMHSMTVGKLCDRIEKLERELAAEKVHSAIAWSEHAKQIDMQIAATMRANSAEMELAAEKALADEVCAASQKLTKTAGFFTGDKGGNSLAEAIDKMNETITAYRKARGL